MTEIPSTNNIVIDMQPPPQYIVAVTGKNTSSGNCHDELPHSMDNHHNRTATSPCECINGTAAALDDSTAIDPLPATLPANSIGAGKGGGGGGVGGVNLTSNVASPMSADKQQQQRSDVRAAAQSHAAAAMVYTGSIMCRICHNSDRIDRLISPCLCKGTLSFVHRHCLEYWLSRSGILHCELCMHRYKTLITYRYGFCESLRIWFRHPNNRGLLQADLMVCSLLTIVTFGLVSISLAGLQYFMLQGNRLGFSRAWTQGSLITFLIIIIAGYISNIYLIVRSQIAPWHRWWRSVRYVRVILPSKLVMPAIERKLHEVGLSSAAAMASTEISAAASPPLSTEV